MRHRPIEIENRGLVDVAAAPLAAGQRYRRNDRVMAVIFDAIVKFDLAFADPRMPEVISFRLYASSMLDAPPGAD